MFLRILVQVHLRLTNIAGVFQSTDAELASASLLWIRASAKSFVHFADPSADKVDVKYFL